MPKPPPHPSQFTMSFGDHLEELRRRLLLGLAAPLPLFVIIFFFSDTLILWLLLPVHRVLRHHDLPTDLQVLSPPEFLLAKLKVSLIAALIVSTPWLLYQCWLFVAPGLYQQERRFVRFLMPGSAILTAAGVSLLYFVMLPLMLHVLVMIGANMTIGPGLPEPVRQALTATEEVQIRTAAPEQPVEGDAWLLVPEMELHIALADDDGAVRTTLIPRSSRGRIAQVFRVSFVVNFTLVLMLGVAIAFQMPLVILLLGWLGLVSADWLRARRKYALLICGVVAAVITPADVASMIIMLLPLYGLYEFGIILLVLAPASAVAEGNMLSLRRRRRRPAQKTADKPNTDKPDASPAQTDKSAQSGETSARGDSPPESDPDSTDGGSDR